MNYQNLNQIMLGFIIPIIGLFASMGIIFLARLGVNSILIKFEKMHRIFTKLRHQFIEINRKGLDNEIYFLLGILIAYLLVSMINLFT